MSDVTRREAIKAAVTAVVMPGLMVGSVATHDATRESLENWVCNYFQRQGSHESKPYKSVEVSSKTNDDGEEVIVATIEKACFDSWLSYDVEFSRQFMEELRADFEDAEATGVGSERQLRSVLTIMFTNALAANWEFFWSPLYHIYKDKLDDA